MELAATPRSRPRALAAVPQFEWPAVGAWTLGFAPVLYLALRGGGYDIVVRSEVGLAAWWVVVLGVLFGALPPNRIGRLGWACTGLLGGFVLWTGAASGWSASA